MNHRLINITTNEVTPCTKVTIDGFTYYLTNDIPQAGDFTVDMNSGGTLILGLVKRIDEQENYLSYHCYPSTVISLSYLDRQSKVIATDNPSIDLPQIRLVDIVETQANEMYTIAYTAYKVRRDAFKTGYRQSQKTHPFTEDDMIDFLIFYKRTGLLEFNSTGENHGKTSAELLEIWKEKRMGVTYIQ